MGTKEEEKEITEIEEKKIRDLCSKNKDFVIDDMLISKKVRDRFISIVRGYNPFITIVYNEAPTLEDNISRREGQISRDVIIGMSQRVSYPSETECMELIINKQK